MELLQAFTYAYIDECSSPTNQILTLFGYLHIAFQPFFINALSMHFVPEAVKKKVEVPVYILCFASAIFMIIQLYPFEWAGQCNPARPLCGEFMCSVSGNWHIAWEVPTNGIGNWFVDAWIPFFKYGFVTYIITAFWLPLMYGSWRITVYQYLMGPFLAMRLTDNINEWPAIWCLLSIGILLIVVKTRVRNFMYVKSWFLWPKSLTNKSD
ncbi:MAG: hypothetical protein COV36_07970 [Alphaproteobacteria bacterium CG11_big_fil_rev_8_21_14_0_20_44_7]|nr:MAG: hypothetical protein COV36_07970 [Alphaproteobacteria bacterium CG11_big_fil_rev_8_21_14_0_20_44_7]